MLPLASPYYAAFLELTGGRAHDSMGGALPITRADVTDYLDETGITDPTERREYRYFIGRLDLRWRVLENRRQARARNAAGGKPEPVDTDPEDDDGSL